MVTEDRGRPSGPDDPRIETYPVPLLRDLASDRSYVHPARTPSPGPGEPAAPPTGAAGAVGRGWAVAGHRPVAIWQANLRDRIRRLAGSLSERERALMGLVWLEIELCDELPGNVVQWTLHCLDTLVSAIEAEEAPSETEPP